MSGRPWGACLRAWLSLTCLEAYGGVNITQNVLDGLLTTINLTLACDGGNDPTTPSGQWVPWQGA